MGLICKALYTGSIPVAASNELSLVTCGAQGFVSLRSPRVHPAPIPRSEILPARVRRCSLSFISVGVSGEVGWGATVPALWDAVEAFEPHSGPVA